MTGEPEGPRLARTVPTSVNELPRVEAVGTGISTDVQARAATVAAPVKRSIAHALRAIRGRK